MCFRKSLFLFSLSLSIQFTTFPATNGFPNFPTPRSLSFFLGIGAPKKPQAFCYSSIRERKEEAKRILPNPSPCLNERAGMSSVHSSNPCWQTHAQTHSHKKRKKHFISFIFASVRGGRTLIPKLQYNKRCSPLLSFLFSMSTRAVFNGIWVQHLG